MQENKDKAEEVNKPLYEPGENELQFTFRAILTGCLIGAMVTAMNIYIGLKIGWSFGGSLIAAILGYGFFIAIKPKKPFTVMEVNITQTAGSGAGTMASASGFLAAIPAIQLSGYELSGWQLMTWCIGVAFLGVMFAVPLRRQYIEQEQLRFPTGLATANTIMAMFASAGESLKKAKALLYVALFAFVFAILSHYFPFLSKIPLHEWTGSELLGSLAGWGFLIYFSPVMLGAGLLIGPRIGTSLMLGAVIGWTTGYIVQQTGWAPHENPMIIHENSSDMWGPRGWILWPGVAIMVSEALVSLGLSWKTFFKAFKGTNKAVYQNNTTKDKNMIPNSWWIGGLIACSIITTLVSWYTFSIPWYFTLLAIFISLLLANVAVRAVGETDINPIGGMGKITQGVFGLMSNVVPVNLMAAAITGAGASQAADMMQDLKTGKLLGASPKLQFKAQLWGIVSGIVFSVPIYMLFSNVWEIGKADGELPAPAAIAWKAVADIMTQGFEALPPMSEQAMLVGLAIGAVLALCKKVPSIANYVPSGMAFGIAFIIPAFYSITMFLGSMLLLLWLKKSPTTADKYVFPVACGAVAGEGMGGVTSALLSLLGL